jgi:glucokinase
MSQTPVLEIGGTHVTAARVDTTTWRVVGEVSRVDLHPDGPREHLLDRFAAAARTVDAPSGATWGVAIPDPFDYRRGVGLFEGVGKFEALYGVDLNVALRDRIGAAPVFVNDADAFTLGEWAVGAASGSARCVGLTLGSGVGSGWLVDGAVVSTGPGVPPNGRIHRLTVLGRPLEDVMSRRAIRAAYAREVGGDADVREIAELARAGRPAAVSVLRPALSALGQVLGPALRDFDADVLVVGGSMAASWDLFEPWLRAGWPAVWPEIRRAAHPETSPLVGAARNALDARA